MDVRSILRAQDASRLDVVDRDWARLAVLSNTYHGHLSGRSQGATAARTPSARYETLPTESLNPRVDFWANANEVALKMRDAIRSQITGIDSRGGPGPTAAAAALAAATAVAHQPLTARGPRILSGNRPLGVAQGPLGMVDPQTALANVAATLPGGGALLPFADRLVTAFKRALESTRSANAAYAAVMALCVALRLPEGLHAPAANAIYRALFPGTSGETVVEREDREAKERATALADAATTVQAAEASRLQASSAVGQESNKLAEAEYVAADAEDEKHLLAAQKRQEWWTEQAHEAWVEHWREGVASGIAMGSFTLSDAEKRAFLVWNRAPFADTRNPVDADSMLRSMFEIDPLVLENEPSVDDMSAAGRSARRGYDAMVIRYNQAHMVKQLLNDALKKDADAKTANEERAMTGVSTDTEDRFGIAAMNDRDRLAATQEAAAKMNGVQEDAAPVTTTPAAAPTAPILPPLPPSPTMDGQVGPAVGPAFDNAAMEDAFDDARDENDMGGLDEPVDGTAVPVGVPQAEVASAAKEDTTMETKPATSPAKKGQTGRPAVVKTAPKAKAAAAKSGRGGASAMRGGIVGIQMAPDSPPDVAADDAPVAVEVPAPVLAPSPPAAAVTRSPPVLPATIAAPVPAVAAPTDALPITLAPVPLPPQPPVTVPVYRTVVSNGQAPVVQTAERAVKRRKLLPQGAVTTTPLPSRVTFVPDTERPVGVAPANAPSIVKQASTRQATTLIKAPRAKTELERQLA